MCVCVCVSLCEFIVVVMRGILHSPPISILPGTHFVYIYIGHDCIRHGGMIIDTVPHIYYDTYVRYYYSVPFRIVKKHR